MSDPVALETLPDDLQELVSRAQMAKNICDLIRRGTFLHDTPANVQNAVAYMRSMAEYYDHAVLQHPRVAEFFPEQHAQYVKRQAQAQMRQAVLLDAGGQPIGGTGRMN